MRAFLRKLPFPRSTRFPPFPPVAALAVATVLSAACVHQTGDWVGSGVGIPARTVAYDPFVPVSRIPPPDNRGMAYWGNPRSHGRSRSVSVVHDQKQVVVVETGP